MNGSPPLPDQTIRLAGLSMESISDGPGLRLTFFLQGCPHECFGCHNPETWSDTEGKFFLLDDFLCQLTPSPLISGITLSGGEPFAQAPAAARIAQWAGSRAYNVWVYSGYCWEELSRSTRPGFQELLQCADVLVDGPFHLEERDLSLPFRGSRNQRLIQVKASRAASRVVTWSPAD